MDLVKHYAYIQENEQKETFRIIQIADIYNQSYHSCLCSSIMSSSETLPLLSQGFLRLNSIFICQMIIFSVPTIQMLDLRLVVIGDVISIQPTLFNEQ